MTAKTQHILSLESAHRLVSLEAATGGVHNRAEGQMILNLQNFLDTGKSVVFTMGKVIKGFSLLGFSTNNKALAFVKSKNFTEIRTLPIHIPMGLDVAFLQYVSVIDKMITLSENVLSDVIKPSVAFIGEYLSDPEKLNSVNGNTSFREIKFREKQIEEVKAELNRCIKDSKTEAMGRYGDYFERNDDYIKVQMHAGAFDKRMERTDKPEDVFEEVSTLIQRIELLQLRIEQDPETYKLAKGVAGYIADVVFNMAKEVEFYAACQTIIKSFMTTVNDNNDLLAKLR